MKLKKCGELSFLLGVILLSFATTLMSKANLGMGMVVAPAYVLAEKIGFIPTGVMCYICQGFLLVVTTLMMGRFKISYLFSFLSAVLFGFGVDFFTDVCFFWIVDPSLWQRVLLLALAIPVNSLSIAFLFHTYLPPQAPEFFVKEFAAKFGKEVYKIKYIYDLCSCVLSIVMSLLFFRKLVFIGVGTIVSSLVNAPLIGLFGKGLDKIGDYSPRFPRLARLFEK
ncbi:MAG: DUF6198 family protein [Oscillospiraceae bacterium]